MVPRATSIRMFGCALWFGGGLASLPVYFAWKFPGRTLTRHIIAIAQVMFSSLLIQVSGGRIETHFHVFGSLAFLAFYRDWKVLVPATLFVALDHFVRGVFWPQTVFGIATAAPWRWLEHAAWVLYEDVFLIISCVSGVADMWSDAVRTAALEFMNRDMQQQTRELEIAYTEKNAIVETALDAVISMDSEGRIVGWNSQAEVTFGWTSAEVLGRSVADTIIPSLAREAHRQGLKRFLETGEGEVAQPANRGCGVHRDGHEFPVELAIAPIKSPHAISFCAFVRDITARQEAADALRNAKEAAEAASYAKTAFLANMSHEIRTPLNAILGFTDVLVDQTDATPQQRDYLQTIHDSGRHLLTLINDVLDLSKIEAGQMHYGGGPLLAARNHRRRRLDPSRPGSRARADARILLEEPKFPEPIHSDPARLRQILMNLIGNAIKFTEVGSVQVAARLKRSCDAAIGHRCHRHGRGHRRASCRADLRSFRPGRFVDYARFGGTGLGLSISRRLAQLLGGD